MTDAGTIDAKGRQRAKSYTNLMWHIGVFVVINGFFWFLDLGLGAEGVHWAYWITIFWGLALAFHAVAYLVGESGFEERKYQKTHAEERRQDAAYSQRHDR